ncbi:hypothetical protein Pcinc_003504 [Petrolisthes cinctipes]|uniref:Uncharacterized protein n=1 Tax=Petrolisthes cinctipes TaxID=88211 RepID=A0AAE1GJ00_PETCI|nr:hypothetical protein Pcinc_003504 [Petrolisthes cinctipes]
MVSCVPSRQHSSFSELLASTSKVVVSSSLPCNVSSLDSSCSQPGCHHRRILDRMGSSVFGRQSSSRHLDTNSVCPSHQCQGVISGSYFPATVSQDSEFSNLVPDGQPSSSSLHQASRVFSFPPPTVNHRRAV